MKIIDLNDLSLSLDALRKTQGHKFNYGHALVLSGGAGKTGAARLAAKAALRIGAGLVTIGAPPSAVFEVATHITALMVRKIKTPADLRAALSDKRITALCMGPGLGATPTRSALIEEALAAKRPTVLDADALTLLAQSPSLRALLHGDCVLTPHGGEFARLFPELSPNISTKDLHERAALTCEAAGQVGCTVVTKGEISVVANQVGQVCVHLARDARAAPWLATAGSGDVLAGFIAGMMARGTPPYEAAQIAVWVHVQCAIEFGPGLIAEDLPDILPRVLRKLLS